MPVGMLLGCRLGHIDGCRVRRHKGWTDGCVVGILDGWIKGTRVGCVVGCVVERLEG